MSSTLLIVGEVIVDFTLTGPNEENKLRLGGIVHAARGLWALDQPFSAAVFLPHYLEKAARIYFEKLGCINLEVIGYILGSPNAAIIRDAKEIDNQGYDFLLRDEKWIENVSDPNREWFGNFGDVFVIPGSFDLGYVVSLLPDARLHLDIAYDIDALSNLLPFSEQIETVFISTSSDLFQNVFSTSPEEEYSAFSELFPSICVIKENRGGSRVYCYSANEQISAPAQLGITINSVGVGDVFDVAFLTFADRGYEEAAYRASYMSSAYAQTTVLDRLRQAALRDTQLKWSTLKALGGVSLSWSDRTKHQIYLAAPDFSDFERDAIEKSVSALHYHNFRVRRPVQENGELPKDSGIHELKETYRKDLVLLDECSLVFAVPTARDPGTLVEVGYAIAKGLPVVVYDSKKECANTMVIAGASCYSSDLEECISAVYTLVSKMEQV